MLMQKDHNKQAQVDRLRAYLLTGRSINPLEAWKTLGIYRLSARVFELREQGEKVVGEFIEVHNHFGEKCFVKAYRMEV